MGTALLYNAKDSTTWELLGRRCALAGDLKAASDWFRKCANAGQLDEVEVARDTFTAVGDKRSLRKLESPRWSARSR